MKLGNAQRRQRVEFLGDTGDQRVGAGEPVPKRCSEVRKFRSPQVEAEAARPGGSLAGYVYGEAAGGWMTPGAARKPHQHFKNGEWNVYRALAAGPRIQTWINGQKVGDIIQNERYKTHPKGFIGLQLHGIPAESDPYTVSYRGIRIREIGADEAAKAVASAPEAAADAR